MQAKLATHNLMRQFLKEWVYSTPFLALLLVVFIDHVQNVAELYGCPAPGHSHGRCGGHCHTCLSWYVTGKKGLVMKCHRWKDAIVMWGGTIFMKGHRWEGKWIMSWHVTGERELLNDMSQLRRDYCHDMSLVMMYYCQERSQVRRESCHDMPQVRGGGYHDMSLVRRGLQPGHVMGKVELLLWLTDHRWDHCEHSHEFIKWQVFHCFRWQCISQMICDHCRRVILKDSWPWSVDN
jgi:hypothetical protein